jgi:hypothetical protein
MSGSSARIASRLGLNSPPTLGNADAAGCTRADQSSTPTNASVAPSATRMFVIEGFNETTRGSAPAGTRASDPPAPAPVARSSPQAKSTVRERVTSQRECTAAG